MGRPSDYSAEVAAAICEMIEEGKTIRQIEAMDEMPSWSSIRRWLKAHEEFRTQYARAREVSGEAFEQQILEEAMLADKETANAARVRIDALKWVAGKRAPKVYGDKMQAELTGKDGGAIEVKDVSPTEAARKIAFILTQATRDAEQG